MSKKFHRVLSLVLVLCMLVAVGLSLVSCGDDEKKEEGKYLDPYAQYHEAISGALYSEVLGEFAEAYAAAKEATSVSERYALMAIAEAKLLQTAVMLPTSTNGGNYAISKVAPNTVGYALWGNDSYRYHQALVATDFIKAEDRAVMKAKWAEVKGTGTYEAWAKAYLLEKGYTLKDSYTILYTSDPNTWDVLATSQAVDSEAIVNTYDGLMEYDNEGTLRPALAESYEISENELVYKFKIRSGYKWVDSQGRELSAITADDFVAGFQHMLDASDGLQYLVQGVVAGVNEYMAGEVGFDQVGVKAEGDYVVYTLEQPTPYFMTMLGYGIFAPMNRAFYVSNGGQFGADFDPAAETYKYGTSPDYIAYCGPYIVTNNTEESTIVFSANESYWNAANINVKTITWNYTDGKDALKGYNESLSGILDGSGLNASSLVKAREDKVPGTDKTYFEMYGYVSATDATSFMAFYNIKRDTFANIQDQGIPSTKNNAEIVRTKFAMLNVHFRRAISYAVDRGAYNAQVVGEELKLNSLRNSYTPGTFVSLPEAVTVKINGVDKTFAAGTFYGEIMQAQMTADGVAMKVWDPTADDGVGSSDGFDGWYNVTEAVKELEIAITELAAQGIVIDKKNPIYIDYPSPTFSPTYLNKANAYKQSLESALGGKVIVNLIDCPTANDWYNAGYFTSYGNEANYDMYDLSGWGPDYGDPSTYLDTFLDDFQGYMTKCIGLY